MNGPSLVTVTARQKAARRQADYRERAGTQVVLHLPRDVVDGLDAYIRRRAAARDEATRSLVITELIRSTVMRRR